MVHLIAMAEEIVETVEAAEETSGASETIINVNVDAVIPYLADIQYNQQLVVKLLTFVVCIVILALVYWLCKCVYRFFNSFF